ncbi:MAG: hypothetical protein AAFX06_26495 [Planctomycetota bacterium]
MDETRPKPAVGDGVASDQEPVDEPPKLRDDAGVSEASNDAEITSSPAETAEENVERDAGSSSMQVDVAHDESDDSLAVETKPAENEDAAQTEDAPEMVVEAQATRDRPHYLIWMPTTKGPVLLGLDVWMGDETLAAAFQAAFDGVLEDAQKEFSESLSWDDFIDHVAENPTKFGSNAMRSSGQKRNLIKNYDRNENGTVEIEEAKRFVLRDSLFSSELRFYGTDAFRYLNRSKSRLFAALDRDDDRELNPDEISVAAQTLIAKLDANSDGCIAFTEAEPEGEMESGAWNRRRSRRHGDVAMDLAGYVNWNNVSYSMNGRFEVSPILPDGAPIKQLDQNRDESIDADEAKEILSLDPSVRLIVRYPASGGAATLEVETSDDNQTIEVKRGLSGDRIDLATDSMSLAITLRESARVNTQIPKEAFDQLDANKDGGLDEDEIPDGAEERLNLEALDKNEDGLLSYQELTERRVEVESIWSRQVRGRAAEYPAAIFAWLDRDHDHFLSAREIAAASELLSTLLGDRESLTPEDFPDAYLVQIGRGEPQQDDALFTPQRERRGGDDSRPAWAIRMDSNGDGEIAALEFPGSIEQFEKLDRDNDGYLSAEEVSSL